MTMNKTRAIAHAIILALVASIATPCLAQPVVVTTMPVSIGDLDLRGAPGRATLDRRIADAVSAVCAKPQAGDLEDIRDYRSCRQDAMRTAMTEAGVRVAAASGILLSAR